MKRFFSCTIILLSALVLLASCSENPGTTTMKLVLTTAPEAGSKTLLPDNSSLLDVTKYTVTGVGPNGKTFTKSSDSGSISIEGLTIGEWSVTAKGLNSANTELVSGTTTFTLTSKAIPQTIVLDTLIGTGTFSLVMDWSLCDVADPKMDVYLTGPDMSSDEVAIPITLNMDKKTATVSESLASGSYKLRVVLKDGNVQVAGFVEAVRISNGTVTSGSHSFLFNELGPNVLTYFRDATGTPIKGSLSVLGNPEEYTADHEYRFIFSFDEPDKVDADGLTIDWYYDGSVVASAALGKTGSSFDVSPKPGVHRVDAIVYNKLLGSTGSAYYSFTAQQDGQKGELALLSQGPVENMVITRDSQVTALPDNKFLVLTPDQNRLYVCSVTSGHLNVVKTFSDSSFAWLTSAKHVFSSSSMNVLVETDRLDGKESYGLLYFDSASNNITEIAGTRTVGSDPYLYTAFVNFSDAAFNNAGGFIYLSDNGSSGYEYVFKVDGTTAKLRTYIVKRSAAYNNLAGLAVSPNGLQMAYTSLASTNIVTGQISSSGSCMTYCETLPNTAPFPHLAFANNQLLLAGNSTELSTFKVNSGDVYPLYKTFGISCRDIKADGSNYFYVMDNSKRIVSFEVNGNEIAQLGSVSLSENPSMMALGNDYLVALTSENISLYGIIK